AREPVHGRAARARRLVRPRVHGRHLDAEVRGRRLAASARRREQGGRARLLARDASCDPVYRAVTGTPTFAGAGWLRPLEDAFSEDDRAAFLPAAVEAGRHAGRLYRVPVRTDVGLLYYRRDLLEAGGFAPPETWDDLVRIARA